MRAQAYAILGVAPIPGLLSGLVDIPNACAALRQPTGIVEDDLLPAPDGAKRFVAPGIGLPIAPDL